MLMILYANVSFSGHGKISRRPRVRAALQYQMFCFQFLAFIIRFHLHSVMTLPL